MTNLFKDAEVRFAALCETVLGLVGHRGTTPALTRETRLFEDLGLDSLKLVELTVCLEERFEVPELPLQDCIDSLHRGNVSPTLGDLAELLEKHPRRRPARPHVPARR